MNGREGGGVTKGEQELPVQKTEGERVYRGNFVARHDWVPGRGGGRSMCGGEMVGGGRSCRERERTGPRP